MYCPKCGKQQPSESLRFCANCGLSLKNAAKLLTASSVPVASDEDTRKGQLSPRTKGILQGVALIPALAGLDFILLLIYDHFDVVNDGAYATLTLILLLALMRIFYAVFLEEGGKPKRSEPTSYEWQREMPISVHQAALPTSDTMPVTGFGSQSKRTGEIVQPRSITEHTTRQLSESG